MQDYKLKMNGINMMIDKLKMEKQKLKTEYKKKYYEEKNVRLKANGKKKSNIPQRVSLSFNNVLININSKRVDNGLDELSFPKITDLIIKHKKAWPLIQKDLIYYNTSLDEDKEADFNDK